MAEDATEIKMETQTATVTDAGVKLPKNSKENRYYYRHREELLEKRRLKLLEDPEYQAKLKEREEKKKQREELEKKRAEKRELRKKIVEQFLNPAPSLPGVK
jgi:hypothetical protein